MARCSRCCWLWRPRPGADRARGGSGSTRRIPRASWISTTAVTMSPPCSSRTTRARTSRRGRAGDVRGRLFPPVGRLFRPIASSTFEIDASVGYKFSTTAASNADIGVERTMLQLGVSHRWPNGFYLGGGLVRNMSPHGRRRRLLRRHRFRRCAGIQPGNRLALGGAALHRHDLRERSYEDVDASHFGAALHVPLRSGGTEALSVGRASARTRSRRLAAHHAVGNLHALRWSLLAE